MTAYTHIISFFVKKCKKSPRMGDSCFFVSNMPYLSIGAWFTFCDKHWYPASWIQRLET